MIASQHQLIRRTNVNNSHNSLNSGHESPPAEASPKSCQELEPSDGPTLDSDKSANASLNGSVDGKQCTTCVDSQQDLNHSCSNCCPTPDHKRGQQKKKRSSNSWLNILNPTYKSRHEEFKRLFSGLVPNNERLVVDYSCALQKEILIHGRLYLSLNYISFYANIFKWETSLVSDDS